jgi:hypothetical protein
MSTKVAPTKRTNKAKPKGRAAASSRVRKLPVVKRTEADLRRAVEQSLELLRYRKSRQTANNVIMAWAMLRALNTYRPDFARENPAMSWEYVRKRPDLLMVTAMAATRFEREMFGEGCETLSWIGCVQDIKTVKALHHIWDGFSEPVEFDLLGETYMALLHD